MFRSDWFLVVTPFGLLGLAALGLAVSQQPSEQQQDHHATGNAPQSVAAETPYVAYPNLYAESCYEAPNHDAADLCAQWRAALAAEKAAKASESAVAWSIIATVLSAMGLLALFTTLGQTERSLKEARRGNLLNMRENARSTRRAVAGAKETAAAIAAANLSANAASAQVRIASDTAVRQLRAYLGPGIVTFTNLHSGGNLSIDIEISNNGLTPANAIASYTTVFVAPYSEEDISFRSHKVSFDRIRGNAITLNPGRKTSITSLARKRLDIATSTAVLAGKLTIVIAGYVSYRDVFGVARRFFFMNFVSA